MSRGSSISSGERTRRRCASCTTVRSRDAGAVPNPARSRVEIVLDDPLGSAPGGAEIFDAAGRFVARLDARADRAAGGRGLVWDFRDARGARVPEGVYRARVRSGGREGSVRIVAR